MSHVLWCSMGGDSVTFAGVEKARVVIKHGAQFRAFFKVFFTKRDTSIYLVPYARSGKFFYGDESLAEKKVQKTFRYDEQFLTDKQPKISIHESGQVHIYAPGDDAAPLAGPLTIPHLLDLKGEHIATVQTESVEALPVIPGSPKTTGPEIDIVYDSAGKDMRVKFIICANAHEPRFNFRISYPKVGFGKRGKRNKGKIDAVNQKNANTFFTLQRRGHAILYVQLARIANPAPTMRKPGVIVVAGWDPNRSPGSGQNFLWVRGE